MQFLAISIFFGGGGSQVFPFSGLFDICRLCSGFPDAATRPRSVNVGYSKLDIAGDCGGGVVHYCESQFSCTNAVVALFWWPLMIQV